LRDGSQDPSQYDAVWIRKYDAEQGEHAGSVVSVEQLPAEQGEHAAELIIRTPSLPSTGYAAFFMRAGASATEYKLESEREHDGCLLKCVYFTERSPVISCSIGVPSQDAFNMTNWKRELSVYLKMPGVDTIYIVDARFEARERAVARVTGGELQRKLSRALLRESEKILKVEFLILSDSGDDWSYQGFVAALRASLDSETGRQELRERLGIRSLAVGAEPAQPTEATAASSQPFQVLPAQDGFTCVGGSQDGLPCAGNASAMSAAQAELSCPGGGACVFSGGLGGGVDASWSLGAILGAFVVVGMAAVAVGMKMSADHRRKKRLKAAARHEQPKHKPPPPDANSDGDDEDVA
jgi:hypothetical protein